MAKRVTETSDASEPAEVVAQLAPRLSVQLDQEGSIAWDRMRPETKEKLERALDKDGRARPGATAASSAPPAQTFPPALCETLYDSLSMLLTGLAQRGGYTREQAAVLAFTPQEKGALVPPTLKVLDKYNTSLGKYQEEIVLGVLLSTIISGKLALLKKQAQVLRMAPPVVSTPQGESQAQNEPVS